MLRFLQYKNSSIARSPALVGPLIQLPSIALEHEDTQFAKGRVLYVIAYSMEDKLWPLSCSPRPGRKVAEKVQMVVFLDA